MEKEFRNYRNSQINKCLLKVVVTFLFNKINTTDFKKISIYTASTFLSKAFSFASIPLFTYFLQKEDFGVIGIFSSSFGFLMPFVSLGILYSTSVDYFKMSRIEYASYLRSTAILPIGASVLICVFLYSLFPILNSKFGFEFSFIFLLPIVAFCNHLYEQLVLIIRNTNKEKLFLSVNIIKVLLEIGISILLIVVFGYGWEGRIIALVISFLFVGIFAVKYLLKNRYFDGYFKMSTVRNELKYSAPSFMVQFSIIFLSNSDRYFVFHYLDLGKTGIYSISAAFATIQLIIGSALNNYYLPFLFKNLANGFDIAATTNILSSYIKTLVAGLLFSISSTYLCYIYLVNSAFSNGFICSVVLMIGYSLWSVTYFLYSINFFYKDSKIIIIQSLAGILICSTLSVLLIPVYKEIGAALTVLFSYSLLLVLTAYINRKKISINIIKTFAFFI
jgi:O-antigen/teichoic acid export membrane protein